MSITERNNGQIAVLDLEGPLSGGPDTDLLRDKVNSLVVQNRIRIILNLGGVPAIDSAGLGRIVASYTTVSKAGGRMVLINLTKRNQDLLTITRLVTVFDTYLTEEEAVKSFDKPAGT